MLVAKRGTNIPERNRFVIDRRASGLMLRQKSEVQAVQVVTPKACDVMPESRKPETRNPKPATDKISVHPVAVGAARCCHSQATRIRERLHRELPFPATHEPWFSPLPPCWRLTALPEPATHRRRPACRPRRSVDEKHQSRAHAGAVDLMRGRPWCIHSRVRPAHQAAHGLRRLFNELGAAER